MKPFRLYNGIHEVPYMWKIGKITIPTWTLAILGTALIFYIATTQIIAALFDGLNPLIIYGPPLIPVLIVILWILNFTFRYGMGHLPAFTQQRLYQQTINEPTMQAPDYDNMV